MDYGDKSRILISMWERAKYSRKSVAVINVDGYWRRRHVILRIIRKSGKMT
jgi:hypothetical protein